MTISTLLFKSAKKKGKVEKIGKAAFYDGTTYHERVLWYNAEDMKTYVMLDGEAYTFKAYPVQCEPDKVIGRI